MATADGREKTVAASCARLARMVGARRGRRTRRRVARSCRLVRRDATPRHRRCGHAGAVTRPAGWELRLLQPASGACDGARLAAGSAGIACRSAGPGSPGRTHVRRRSRLVCLPPAAGHVMRMTAAISQPHASRSASPAVLPMAISRYAISLSIFSRGSSARRLTRIAPSSTAAFARLSLRTAHGSRDGRRGTRKRGRRASSCTATTAISACASDAARRGAVSAADGHAGQSRRPVRQPAKTRTSSVWLATAKAPPADCRASWRDGTARSPRSRPRRSARSARYAACRPAETRGDDGLTNHRAPHLVTQRMPGLAEPVGATGSRGSGAAPVERLHPARSACRARRRSRPSSARCRDRTHERRPSRHRAAGKNAIAVVPDLVHRRC